MTREQTILRPLERLVAISGRAVAWLLLPLMAIIIFDVVGRRFFNVGSVALQEMEWHLHACICLIALSYAYQTDDHVRIDIFHERFSVPTRLWIELVGCIVFLLPYAAVVAYFGYRFWLRSWDVGETSSAPGGLPARWIIKLVLPLGFLLLILQAVSTIGRTLMRLRSTGSGGTA
jgi:TRAP-type mannitol/chloroaromatic compound transport system permease small subunit